MKRILSILAIMAIATCQLSAQCSWWVKQFGGSLDEKVITASTTSDGAIVFAGLFNGSLTLGNQTIVSKGDKDIFIAKADTLGNIIWVKQAGSSYSDNIKEIVLDKNNNIYAIGEYYPGATFDSQTLTSMGSKDIFWAKYSSNGELIWIKTAGSTSDWDNAGSIAINDSLIYLTINYSDNITIDNKNFPRYFYSPTQGRSFNYSSALLKYNTNGDQLEVKRLSNSINKLACDSLNNIYLYGDFSQYSNEVIIDSTVFDTLNSVGSSDLFLLRLDKNLNPSWVQSMGGSSSEYVGQISLLNNNAIIITGDFNGGININDVPYSSFGLSDVFVSIFDSLGNVGWVKTIGSNNGESIGNLYIDKDQNLIVSGRSYVDENNSTYFAGIPYTGMTNYIAKFNSNGQVLMVENFGYDNKVLSINDNYYIFSNLYYYSQKFGAKTLSPNGNYDFVMSKIKDFNHLKINTPEICMVSTEGNKNQIILNKGDESNISRYVFYRDGISQYDSIGNLNKGGANYIIDVKSLPAQRAYMYKVLAVDNCGYKTEFSNSHTTIHLLLYAGPNNVWNLNWSEYEGSDYSYYKIYRGTSSTTMTLYDSIGTYANSYVDLSPLPNTTAVYYQIEAVMTNECAKTSLKSLVSNIATSDNVISIDNLSTDELTYTLAPNPNDGNFKIIMNTSPFNGTIDIYNLNGGKEYASTIHEGENDFTLDYLQKGIYFVKINTGNILISEKLIIQ